MHDCTHKHLLPELLELACEMSTSRLWELSQPLPGAQDRTKLAVEQTFAQVIENQSSASLNPAPATWRRTDSRVTLFVVCSPNEQTRSIHSPVLLQSSLRRTSLPHPTLLPLFKNCRPTTGRSRPQSVGPLPAVQATSQRLPPPPQKT